MQPTGSGQPLIVNGHIADYTWWVRDVERCPKCHGQGDSCDCLDEDDVARAALKVLKCITVLPETVFWRDEVAPTEAAAHSSTAVVDHRQVTDADLLAKTQRHDGKLAAPNARIAVVVPVRKDRYDT